MDGLVHTLWSLFGSFLFAYFVSRTVLRLIPPMRSGLARLALVHLASWVLMALIVGFAKAYFTPFAWRDALLVIGPQLFWFVIDYLRGKAQTARA